MAAIELAQRVVVSDAGPIIHLSELDCLDVLSDFDEVLIPPIVWDEIERHQPKALTTTGVAFRQSLVGVEAPEAMESLSRLFALHRGDSKKAERLLAEALHGLKSVDRRLKKWRKISDAIRSHGQR